MEKYRERFKRGTAYTISEGGLKNQLTYCGRFPGPKRTGLRDETFLVFRLEPRRFPRVKSK